MTHPPTISVICINNEGYLSKEVYSCSLEVGKLYVSIPDPDAEKDGLIRVIDESGEDYLYPKEWFKEAPE